MDTTRPLVEPFRSDPTGDLPLHAPNASHSTPFHAFAMSFLVILVSEIGDKTFIIAAVLAMRHSRLLIFSAAMSALAVMTLLSALAGSVFPSLISKLYTQLIVSILFLVFGMKMFKEASEMTGGEAQEELNQVSMELEKKSKDAQVQEALELGARSIRRKEEDVPQDELLLISDSPDDRLNMKSNDTTDASGRKMRDAQQRSSKKKKRSVLRRFKRVCLALVATVLSPIWIEAFVMTFLAEWGDRSQVATIALAGAEDFWYVTLGGLLGHSLCSGVAVLGGRYLAAKISIKAVTLMGGTLFIFFGLLSLYQLKRASQ